jgi:lysophospholipase L1-like esterase
MASVRICFVGDSLTAGTGDAQARGWPSRLSAEEATQRGHDITCYNLGVRAETSQMIAARWERECTPRLPDHVDGRLVFMFGLNDMADQEDGAQGPATQRVNDDRSIEAARAMLSRARSWKPTLWLGPTPPQRGDAVVEPGGGVRYTFYRYRVKAINARYQALADDLAIPYLDLYSALSDDPAWDQSMAEGDGVHPTAEGYQKLTRLIADWSAWRAWLN